MPEIGRLLIIIGLFFNFIAILSLLRMPDVYTRLQAAARSVTLGTGSIMLGVFVCQGFSATGFKALFVTAFLILICPVCVHALAKGAYKSKVKLADESVCDQYQEDLNI
ncbi:MAG: monovalent cation/H(+) antiporter subunit G [Candidatus Omnitrophica bacterium]|nr:monovalent cation/H(+) antiporter subunit G [Candidatus Omnitrophota bacterium]